MNRNKKVATPTGTIQKAFSETATLASDSVPTNNATVVSKNAHLPTDTQKVATSSVETTANVIKNLDYLYSSYQKLPNRTRGFIANVGKALSLHRHESSQYGAFTLPNGNKLVIRLSNHNAKVSNFDRNAETEGVSLVISSTFNKQLHNDGHAHITEYFYRKRDLENAPGKPLVQIIGSVKTLLFTGEFHDTTGLAERQEINNRGSP